jgi:uroporphyrinogen decarboxylase
LACGGMTPKERWLAVLSGNIPDRVPTDYWGTPEATQKLMAHLSCSEWRDLAARLHIDRPVNVEPSYVGPPIRPGQDMYGCRYAEIDYGLGVYAECVYNPLVGFHTVEEVEEHYTWPSVDWFDYSVVPDQIVGWEEYPVRGGGSEPFYMYAHLRGQERAYMDLVHNPELVHYCLGKLFDFSYENTRRIYEQIPGKVTFSYVAEDLGSQENLLFSPDVIREFMLPGMKRMIDLAHEAGASAFCHSDGAIRKIIPDLISIGVDILNPIQWRCKGMDREDLKRDFGRDLIFHGGMDNQQTLAFGSVEDVQHEAMYNIQILGEDGGYILAPCHNVQAVSPVENIVALYETAYQFGHY